MISFLFDAFGQLSRLTPFLLDTALKSSFIIICAWLLSLLARRTPASFRHLLWRSALLAVLLLPLASLVLPALYMPDFSSAGSASSFPVATNVTIPSPAPVVSDEALLTSWSFQKLTPVKERVVSASESASRFWSSSRSEAAALPIQIDDLAATLYICTVLVLMFFLFCGVWRVFRMTACLEPVDDPELLSLLELLRVRYGIHRQVRLFVKYDLVSPVTFGLWRPVILLPPETEHWDEAARRDSLAHELAHVARLDWLSHLSARLTCALLWFNPLVWLAARRMAMEAEHACDDRALAYGALPSSYATHLVSVARHAQTGGMRHAVVGMASRSELSFRVEAILDPKRGRASVHAARAAFLSMAALIFLMPVAALRPTLDAIEAPILAEPVIAHMKPPAEKSAKQQPSSPVSISAPVELEPREASPLVLLDSALPAITSLEIEARTVHLPQLTSVERQHKIASSGPDLPASFSLADAALIDRLLTSEDSELRSYGQAMRSIDLTAPSSLPLLKPGVGLDEMQAALNADHPLMRRIALRGLAGQKPHAVEALLSQAVRDQDPLVRLGAVSLMNWMELGDPALLSPLLSDPVPTIRVAALHGCSRKRGLNEAQLTLALTDGDAQVRQAALECTGRQLDNYGVARLEKLLAHSSPLLRQQAVFALGRRSANRSIEALLPLLGDPDLTVRSATAATLGQLKGRVATYALEGVAASETERQEVRLQALSSLGKIGAKHSAPLLSQLAEHSSWRIRASAVSALASFRKQRSVLRAALADKHPSVREAAERALARYPIKRTSQRPRWTAEASNNRTPSKFLSNLVGNGASDSVD